jgi:broad specificity phosphatase PhoE
MEGHVVLIRHGETDYNAANIIQGQSCVSKLTDEARIAVRTECVDSLRKVLRAPIRMRSSHLLRAMETAAIIQDSLLLTDHITPDSRLAEFNFGLWEGRSRFDVESDAKVVGQDFFGRSGSENGGETIQQVTGRALACLQEVAECDDGTDILVTHGGVIRSIMCSLFGVHHMKMRVPNAVVVPLPKTVLRAFFRDGDGPLKSISFPRELYHPKHEYDMDISANVKEDGL